MTPPLPTTPPLVEDAPPQPEADRIEAALEGLSVTRVPARDGIATFELAPDALHEALSRLKDRADFATITLVTGVDRLPEEPRFEVIHQLLSLSSPAPLNRVRLRTRVGGEDPRVPTCIDLWPGAAYMERECYDLLGIVFEGHEGLKRLLMPQEYIYHPLRKDFPHQGIEPDRLYREWDARRRASWHPEDGR